MTYTFLLILQCLVTRPKYNSSLDDSPFREKIHDPLENGYFLPPYPFDHWIKVLLAPAIVKGVDAEGFNLQVNNGAAAGQQIFHLHFHITPRYEGDNLQMWKGAPYEEGEQESTQERILKHLG